MHACLLRYFCRYVDEIYCLCAVTSGLFGCFVGVIDCAEGMEDDAYG